MRYELKTPWQQAALTDGEELFQELCAACHGVSGKGDGSVVRGTAPSLIFSDSMYRNRPDSGLSAT